MYLQEEMTITVEQLLKACSFGQYIYRGRNDHAVSLNTQISLAADKSQFPVLRARPGANCGRNGVTKES